MLRPNYSIIEHMHLYITNVETNYSTVEHVTALIKMLRPSLVTRDTRFMLKEVFLFSCKKLFFCLFSGYLL